MKVAVRDDETHNPWGEAHWVSGLRENLTSRSDGEGLETEPWNRLRHRREAKAAGNSYSLNLPLPRQSFTRQLFHKSVKQHLGFEDVATHGFDAVMSHVHWVYCAYILLHMAPPGLSPGRQSIGDKQRALQQGLADKEKRQILQKLTQIGGVQRYKDELRQALAGI